MDLTALLQACAPDVHPATMRAIVAVESGGRPFAIGVVGGRLVRQPDNLAEALATAGALERAGVNFSLGLAQLNRHNLARHGLDHAAAFDPCDNLRVAARILAGCYRRAAAAPAAPYPVLRALSCYYSGNLTRGFAAEGGGPSYVQRVLAAARLQAPPPPVRLSSVPPQGAQP